MPSEMRELLRDNSPLRHPTAPQVEQHTQRSEIVRYLRGLNEWLEWDVRDRRAEIQSMSAHLEQTHNKVIPLLNQIVRGMDLGPEGVRPDAVRSPSDDAWDVISSSNPSTRVAPTVSSVSTDKVSSSPSSSPSGESPGFLSLQHPHPSQLSVNMGRPPLGPELDHTLAPSLPKTAMPSSDPTETGKKGLAMPEQNDTVRTQLRDLMKAFAEHKDEIARKHELAEERWAANQARWEDKHVKDAATHNMLERILANQADIQDKFAAFKDEILAELRKSSLSSADHAVTQPPSLHPGPQVPSSSSSLIIVGHEQPPPVVPISCLPSASGKPPSPVRTWQSPPVHKMIPPSPPSRVVPPLCITTPPGIPAPIIIPFSAPPMPLGVGPENPAQIIRDHYTSLAPSSPSPVPPIVPPIGIVRSGGPPVPYPLPQQDPMSVPIGVPTRWRTPYPRSPNSSRSSSPSAHCIRVPVSEHGRESPRLMPVFVQPIPPAIPAMSPHMVTTIPTVVVPRVSSDSEGSWPLPPRPEPITVIYPSRSRSRSRSHSPVTAVPIPGPTVIPVIREGSRSPRRPYSPHDAHRPRSPYDPHRPRSPYGTHRPRSPYDQHRPRSPYGSRYGRHGEYYGPSHSGRDPYEEEWRRRPRSPSPGRHGRYYDYEYWPRPGRHYPEYRSYRPPRSRSWEFQECDRPRSRDSREGCRPYRPRSPEKREKGRHGTRDRPRAQSPEYYYGDRHGLPRRPRSSEYEEGDRIRRPRSPDSRDSRGPHDDHDGRPSTSRPIHPRSEPMITVGRTTTAVHLPEEYEYEVVHGLPHIPPHSEHEYKPTITPPPLHPYTLESRPSIRRIPAPLPTEETEGSAEEYTLPLPPLVPPPLPSATEYLHRTPIAGPEHVIPTLPSHAPTDVRPRSPSPSERRVRLRSPRPAEHTRPRSPSRLAFPEDDERTLEEEWHPITPRIVPVPGPHEAHAITHPGVPPPVAPSPVVQPVPIRTVSPPHAVHAVPPHVIPAVSPAQAVVMAPSGPSDVGLADAEQERQNRFDELAGALDRTIIDLQDGEVKRDDNYRTNEGVRVRIFIENERKRENEMEKRLEAMWKRMEDRLAASLPSAIAVPEGSEWTPAPPGELSFEGDGTPDAFELSPGLLGAPVPAHRQVDAASRYAADIREANLLEREAALAERERALELQEAAQNRMQEEHKGRIRALEDELSAVRGELAEEKMARAAEEAGQHERKRAEMLAQNDLMRDQVGDLIGLLLHRQDVKAIRRRDDYSSEDGKTREGLAVIGPRFAYACLGICLYSVFLVAVWT